jgi:multiple sugar transport system permease protein
MTSIYQKLTSLYPKAKIKKILVGSNVRQGLIYRIVVYSLLVVFGFIFIYPLLFMIVTSLKSTEDLVDTSVKWIPSFLEISNYATAITEIRFFDSLLKSVVVALVPSLINTAVGCLTAYGFSRFRFPGRKVLFAIMLATFIIPRQLIFIPQYVWFKKLDVIGSLLSYIIPSTFGQGLFSAIYILILYSMFNLIPKQLEESARIDGASNFTVFTKVALPLVIPGIITVFLFSFVWYWNDSATASLFLAQPGKEFWATLPVRLEDYQNAVFDLTKGGVGAVLYQGIRMAGTLLSILPLLVIYFSLQRYFIESVERSGIAGE